MKRPLRGIRCRAVDELRVGQHAIAIAVRRRYYVQKRPTPLWLRARMGLDDDEAYANRRIEVGGGPHPQRGFVHVDNDPSAAHLEALTDAWNLPIEDDWAEELVAVHVLEHVEPPRLRQTLSEWHRVLQPGGSLRVHVPNGLALMRAFIEAPVDGKWRAMGSLLGQYCGPSASTPAELSCRSDHQIIFDPDLLTWALAEASFVDVTDVSQRIRDRHSDAWDAVIPSYSLVMEARKQPV
jgi:SAM-dependent methyltransferase